MAIKATSAEPGPILSLLTVWSWRWAAHHRRNGRIIPNVMSAGSINPVRVTLAGRNIGVDAFVQQLVIRRCLSHGAPP
ncbi:MAG: hypothetical protein LC808_27675 [Actinobacteria bacterium]|nr:hypothetical protein [Actinomycetota bacterium]